MSRQEFPLRLRADLSMDDDVEKKTIFLVAIYFRSCTIFCRCLFYSVYCVVPTKI